MKWRKSLQIASIYVGTVVGAGFATGKEIVEFFSRFGFMGLVGIIISGLLFIFLGVKIMVLAIRLQAKSYQQFNQYIFGPFIAPFINILMFFMLIGVTAVMLSGAGAVFVEQLHLSKNTGIYLTIVLAVIVFVIGTKGLIYVNSIVVPLLIFFNIFLVWQILLLPNISETIFPIKDVCLEIIHSALAYAAFNLALAQAVLVPAAAEINDIVVVKWGGIIGGIILTMVLAASHLVLIQLPELTIYQIPMGMMMEKLAPTMYIFFVVLIYGEIFTTLVGNIYGLERYLHQHFPTKKIGIGLFIFIITFLISQINYGTLLSVLYPLFGSISLVFLILLIIKGKTES